ncbi:putative aminoadipate reductase [Roridomyces roridus]|uniref:Aminoadipate reductase n=1 Tax=Roridomyces roridus TaxID=1738132 RepID=A0AAD7C1Y5_9AGAR|nr:putative aminoadipate reductase [Roridomyces roridus]
MSGPLPPLDCSLNFGEIVDFHLSHENRGTAYSFPDQEGRVTDISRFEFTRAAHRVAHLLRPQRQGAEGQRLAIIALTDSLIYQTVVAGCLRAGIVPFPISNRNSPEAIVHLLSSTDCHRMLMTRALLGPLDETISAELSTVGTPYDLSVEEIPLLGQMYPHLGHETPQDEFFPYPVPATRTAVDEVAIYLHSSGSTGLPKSIPITHGNIIHWAGMDTYVELRSRSPRHAVGALPSFHAFGMTVQLFYPLLTGGTVCIFPLTSTASEHRLPMVPSGDNNIRCAREAKATGLVGAPAHLVEWLTSKEHIEYLKSLKLLTYGGASLTESIGDALVQLGVNLVVLYGGTEFGPVSTLPPRGGGDPSEWAWFGFSDQVRVRWVPQGDGTFELQLLTIPETGHLAIENLPDTGGYATKDLFKPHPTKPNLYKIVGRLDDVLIMGNGEKTVPGPMEDVILSSPFIDGSIMFGRERNQVGLLVEPRQLVDPLDEDQLIEFRNLIWPVVEEANKIAPSFARIYKEMILFTQPGKPMVRSPKGTVVRKCTLALYNAEIDTLYRTIEASGDAGITDVGLPCSWTAKDLEPWLLRHATLLADRSICPQDDLFNQGFNSLNTTFLRHRIVGALRKLNEAQAARKIAQNIVYANPSVRDLAEAVERLVREGDTVVSDAEHKAAMEAMITRYSGGLDASIPHKPKTVDDEGAVVLLTGTTGALGSHILAMLLASDSVKRVYALNRRGSTAVAERQGAAFLDRSLDRALLDSGKLVYLEGDTSKADLSLPADVWDALRDTLTVIIHNAWMLDFNKRLSSFESHVKGTRHLIRLASSASARFLFTSSVASAQGWDRTRGPFPEELQLDADVAVGNGYGESKYVSERILAASGLHATSFRIGQISGSTESGAWSTTDWVPAIVKSSLALGAFPSDLSNVVAWLPAEAVSSAIVDAALISPETRQFTTINLVHPRPVPWDCIMSSMAGMVDLPMIPFAEWVQRVKGRAVNATAGDLDSIPGIKLLDFLTRMVAYQANIEFSTTKAQELSSSIRSLTPLDAEDARRWMAYWRRKEFI